MNEKEWNLLRATHVFQNPLHRYNACFNLANLSHKEAKHHCDLKEEFYFDQKDLKNVI